MQMVGLKSQALGYEYTGAIQGSCDIMTREVRQRVDSKRPVAVKIILRTEGIKGLVSG